MFLTFHSLSYLIQYNLNSFKMNASNVIYLNKNNLNTFILNVFDVTFYSN